MLSCTLYPCTSICVHTQSHTDTELRRAREKKQAHIPSAHVLFNCFKNQITLMLEEAGGLGLSWGWMIPSSLGLSWGWIIPSSQGMVRGEQFEKSSNFFIHSDPDSSRGMLRMTCTHAAYTVSVGKWPAWRQLTILFISHLHILSLPMSHSPLCRDFLCIHEYFLKMKGVNIYGLLACWCFNVFYPS